MENNKTRQQRIDTVNKIIQKIASTGRQFFKHGIAVSEIFQRNGRLYMVNEWNGEQMCLNTKNGYPPKHFHHGGTLWSLTKDFKEFIQTGADTNHNNGYGGLYCPHWGYPDEAMKEIRQLATELGYLHGEPKQQ